jgi:Asp/Glu/hydantoin racemase
MTTSKPKTTKLSTVGILGWEIGEQVTLAQLEQMPGNICHADTFDFPIIYKRVKGAHYETVVKTPTQEVLANMIEVAQDMEKNGVRAIMGNCGFNAIFQKELADAVTIPLFSSSLLQVPMVLQMLKKGQKIGILTADKECLTEQHFKSVGIEDLSRICVEGIEKTSEFAKIRTDSNADLNIKKFRSEVMEIANNLIKNNPSIGAIVLECTDLPPLAGEMRQLFGLPVFDIVTLAHFVYESLEGNRYN